ncbi:MlaD family protein [Rubellimicrobium aerolatum]|uniref:MlaD family protein n=1 Tax=Rubellimicrobium aerolatum TaxID=490979 RepID=A0ABW0S6D3_9RHOB|nr:MlaD family protein [Rubellimicrobium aerolatum]MBP1804547.1 ABC-type transporter Mla subunit MlaD [Rubellimicrobium aerolatum]
MRESPVEVLAGAPVVLVAAGFLLHAARATGQGGPRTYRATARMAVNAAVPIPDDSAAVVASEGLLGGAFIEIVPGGSPDSLPDGGGIRDARDALSLSHLLLRYVSGGEGSAP